MDTGSMFLVSKVNQNAVRADCALCNAKIMPYGLALTEEQMSGLMHRRVEALRATGRVEFGRGVLTEIVTSFCDSPYLVQDTLENDLADIQDAFYRLKEDSEEELPDQDLIDAMKHAFDTEANGSVEYLGSMPASRFTEIANGLRGDEHAVWSEAEAYEESERDDEADEPTARDGLDRVYERQRHDRPDELFAAGYYDEHNELYRIGFDSNSRIGGSSLR